MVGVSEVKDLGVKGGVFFGIYFHVNVLFCILRVNKQLWLILS